MLDTREFIETPEGALLPLEVAGLAVRALAYGIDWAIRGTIMLLVIMVLAITGRFGAGLILVSYFVLEWLYPVAFEVWNRGATPGKKILRLMVVNDDGTPVGFSTSLLRNLLMAADFLPLFYAAGVVSSLCHPQFKRLGDIAAGTLVIHRPQAKTPLELDAGLGYRPLPPGLTVAEQRALVTFAERHRNLTTARQHELANQLAPLLHSDEPVTAILQMANSIAGSQRS